MRREVRSLRERWVQSQECLFSLRCRQQGRRIQRHRCERLRAVGAALKEGAKLAPIQTLDRNRPSSGNHLERRSPAGWPARSSSSTGPLSPVSCGRGLSRSMGTGVCPIRWGQQDHGGVRITICTLPSPVVAAQPVRFDRGRMNGRSTHDCGRKDHIRGCCPKWWRSRHNVPGPGYQAIPDRHCRRVRSGSTLLTFGGSGLQLAGRPVFRCLFLPLTT